MQQVLVLMDFTSCGQYAGYGGIFAFLGGADCAIAAAIHQRYAQGRQQTPSRLLVDPRATFLYVDSRISLSCTRIRTSWSPILSQSRLFFFLTYSYWNPNSERRSNKDACL